MTVTPRRRAASSGADPPARPAKARSDRHLRRLPAALQLERHVEPRPASSRRLAAVRPAASSRSRAPCALRATSKLRRRQPRLLPSRPPAPLLPFEFHLQVLATPRDPALTALARTHRSFSVVSANSASTSPAIQNRAMIFDSVPAQRLEMMMQRRHLENALAAQLEAAHLQDHRNRLQHEHRRR